MSIAAVFFAKVYPGYQVYKRLIRRYGEDVKILRTAWHGTGDYYICGMFLREYLRKNNIKNFVFLVSKNTSEEKVTELFSIYWGHTVRLSSPYALTRFSDFMPQFYPLCKSFECSEQRSFIGEELKGFNGLSLMDFYIWYGFEFEKIPRAEEPVFSDATSAIMVCFEENGLSVGKTVLLSPYSTCSASFLPPSSMWEQLAKLLKEKGYTVATNCFGSEEPVKGTVRLSVDYAHIVPFLNCAGYFIGVRSGLCDIISSSLCQKFIVHISESAYWPNGRSISFVGLKNMNMCSDTYEIMYDGAPEKIVEFIKGSV